MSDLIRPATKYLGVAIDGVPQDMAKLSSFAKTIGKKPNMVQLYESFDDSFAAAEVRKIYQYGGLALLTWEPFKAKPADIAAGRFDKYITSFAASVRLLDLPVAIDVRARDERQLVQLGTAERGQGLVARVAARARHLPGAGATNVIWTWTPNVIQPAAGVPLKPLYPGDAYVDWIGIDGYFTEKGETNFADLFGSTMVKIRSFTKKPFLIKETGIEPGSARPEQIRDLFDNVAQTPGMVGVVYFNNNGSGQWKLDLDANSLSAFRTQARRSQFGFVVR